MQGSEENMKRLFFFCIFLFLSMTIYAKDFSIPTDEEIRKMYPTLKETKLGLDFYDVKVFYSEKYSSETTETTKYYDQAILFNGIPETRIGRWTKHISFYSEKISIPLTLLEKVVITDEGIIYLYGRYKGYFINTLEKLKIIDNKLVPIEQPFYCIDKNQIAKESFHIKKACDDASPDVAIIAKNSNVKAIGIKEVRNKDNEIEDWVLIQSSLGLIGWAKVVVIGEINYLQGLDSFIDVLHQPYEGLY